MCYGSLYPIPNPNPNPSPTPTLTLDQVHLRNRAERRKYDSRVRSSRDSIHRIKRRSARLKYTISILLVIYWLSGSF